MPLQASISEVPGVSSSTYVEFSGEFDGESVTNFSTFWNKQVTQDRRRYFILEMSKLTKCSEEAVQCLRLFNDAVREKHGGLAIVNPSPAVVTAMRTTGLGSLFTIFLEYKRAFEYLRELKEKQRQRELTERLAGGAGGATREETRIGGPVQPPSTSTPKSMQRLAQGGETQAAPKDDGPPNPSGPQTQYQLRGYTGDGRTFRGGATGEVEPIAAPVLLAIPESREYLGLRTFLIERIEAFGLAHAFVLPLTGKQGFDWMEAGFRQAKAFVGEVSPVPATREMTVGVAVAATVARVYLAPEQLLLLSSVSVPPHPTFADIPNTLYKSSKQGLEQLAGHVDQILQRIESNA